MKLALICDEQAWFWIFNEETGQWEAWYEEDDSPAERVCNLDRATLGGVIAIIGEMSRMLRADAYGTIAH